MTATITGTVTDAGTGKPFVAIASATSLNLTLLNRSGHDIALIAGSSAFAVHLPVPALFSAARLSAMTVTTPGWKGAVDVATKVVNIACTQGITWTDGATLVLRIGNVVSDGPPANGTIQIAPVNVDPDAPLSILAPFSVAGAPAPGNLSLADTLQVGLESQGIVYRSTAADPLTNTLFLNLKNVGATALATSDASSLGTPQILVSFVYGGTSGALASDEAGSGTPPTGSAWNIHVGLGPAQTAWTAVNPQPTGQSRSPQWTLRPSSTNTEILGAAAGDHANVTFEFSRITSFTPVGHTQMIVLCSGFAKDARTKYDDHQFVLDISKQNAPPTRGVVAFAGPAPVLDVDDPKSTVALELRWAMFDVAAVNLITSHPAIPAVRRTYSNPKPLAYDSVVLKVPPPQNSEAIFATLQAFDGGGGYLNSLQFTAYAQLRYLLDPAGAVYRIRLVGDTFWLLRDYAYETTGSSVCDGGDGGFGGRLYDWEAAHVHAPDGWCLPTTDDWKALTASYDRGAGSYAALIDGGVSGFDARLGGYCDETGRCEDQGQYGYYWTAERGCCTEFSDNTVSVDTGVGFPPRYKLSVRYVRRT
ncbi:FISUMP domain-containing protein [Embleya sp. NBC_00896]|uniref:FISUMP domain-containing protein n=1 Tax=Embleya sp. NBC_00896 TaxID=2975961 RepID=UPI002F909B96|nr:fibrobacter succinogenes major paralogous domain-containing protein [Embleya sp. NBC_00896]